MFMRINIRYFNRNTVKYVLGWNGVRRYNNLFLVILSSKLFISVFVSSKKILLSIFDYFWRCYSFLMMFSFTASFDPKSIGQKMIFQPTDSDFHHYVSPPIITWNQIILQEHINGPEVRTQRHLIVATPWKKKSGNY